MVVFNSGLITCDFFVVLEVLEYKDFGRLTEGDSTNAAIGKGVVIHTGVRLWWHGHFGVTHGFLSRSSPIYCK